MGPIPRTPPDPSAHDPEGTYAHEGDLRENLRVAGDVLVRGDVGEGVRLEVGGRLKVFGWILPGAEVTCGRDAEVLGGVKQAVLSAGGSVYTESLQAATICAIDYLQVLLGVTDSTVSVLGRVQISDGGVIGGTLTATERIAARFLGEPLTAEAARDFGHPGRPTLIRISLSAVRAAQLVELDRRIERVEQDLEWLRNLWQPLLDDANAGQALSASEFAELEDKRVALAQAERLHESLEDEYRVLEARLLARMSSRPCVSVGRAIYPGVDIRLWNTRHTFVSTAIGPIEISPTYDPQRDSTGRRPATGDH